MILVVYSIMSSSHLVTHGVLQQVQVHSKSLDHTKLLMVYSSKSKSSSHQVTCKVVVKCLLVAIMLLVKL